MNEAELLAELAALPSENYTPEDRYRDFRKVFTTEEGKRVFREILSWAKMYHTTAPIDPIDPYRAMFHEGARSIGIKLLATMSKEPPQKPAQQQRKR